jgi:lipoprotein signal peptidase
VGLARRRFTILALAAAVVAIDQATKTWALHHTVEPKHLVWTLRLALTFNSGAAFGLGRGRTTVFVLGAVALVVVLMLVLVGLLHNPHGQGSGGPPAHQ